jgi:hypothetical protein
VDTGVSEQDSGSLIPDACARPAGNFKFQAKGRGTARFARLCCCLAFLFSGRLAAQTQPFSGETALSDESAVHSESGVRAAETRAHDAVAGLLKSKGIAFSERELMADYGAFGSSIEVQLTGKSGAGALFTLAVPLAGTPPDTGSPPDGDLTWGQELAVSFIEAILREPPPFDALVCFLAASWPDPGPYPYAGLEALLDGLERREDTAIAYCDFPAPPAAPSIVRGRGAAGAPLELAEPFTRFCGKAGIRCFFDPGANGIDGVALARSGGVPVLYIGGAARPRLFIPRDYEKITPAEAAALFYDYAAYITKSGTGTDMDRNYTYIGFNGRGVFISEYAFVLLTLFGPFFLVFLCFALYFASRSRCKRIFTPVLTAALLITLPVFIVLQLNGAKNTPSTPESFLYPQKAMREQAGAENYLAVTVKTTPLLERKIVKTGIEARSPPLRYRLFFIPGGLSPETPAGFIYDAPMPYRMENGRIEFMLGLYPPARVDFEITLPAGLNGEFTLDALFENGAAVTKIF